MRFDTILRELGADRYSLTEAERRQIDTQGYLAVPVFDAREVADFRAACDRLVEELKLGISDFDGGYRIHDLIGREPFDAAWSHPKLLAVARYWLEDEFKPMSLNYRCPLPGGGNQGLHSDQCETPYCQAIIALCDLTERNGAPRVVPGTHLLSRLPQDDMTDTTAPHPREIKLVGPAGTAFFFDGNLWHSGTRNDSDQPRPVLHSGFMCRHSDSVMMERQRGCISPQTYRRMSSALRNFLDFRVVDGEYDSQAKPWKAPVVAA